MRYAKKIRKSEFSPTNLQKSLSRFIHRRTVRHLRLERPRSAHGYSNFRRAIFPLEILMPEGIIMGGRGSVIHTTQVQTVYRPDPIVAQKLAETQAQLAKIEQQAAQAGDPKLYSTNEANLLTNFVDKLKSLNITESIAKAPGERHVGVIGDISCGKSTFLNAMFGLSLSTALGHCTTKCEPVHRLNRAGGSIVYWDVPGKNDDFRFYKLENLAFVKSLDTCLVLYDNDINMIRDLLRVVTQICNKVILVRTKLDQYTVGNVRTPAEEKTRDIASVTTALGKTLPVYFVSSHNVQFARGDQFDWATVRSEIMS